jgi:hypothetical protein
VVVDAEGHLLAGHAQAGEGQAELLGAGEGSDQLVVARRHVGRSQAKQSAEVVQREAGFAGLGGEVSDVADEGDGRGPDHR